MGLDFDLFVHPDRILSQLICPICKLVLDRPVQTHTDHLFCEEELLEWMSLSDHPLCPMTKTPLDPNQIKKPSRIILNMLNELEMYCVYKGNGCAWEGCQDDLIFHRKTCEYKPPMELCQEIKEKNNVINHLTKKLDAATLSIAELVEENRLLKMKIYECNRKFRIYDAFLSGRGNNLHNDDDNKVSSMKDNLDEEDRSYLKNNYHENKNEIFPLGDAISYTNDYDDYDRTRSYINDDNYDDDVVNGINEVESTSAEFDDMHNLMKLRNLRSFKDSQQEAINKDSMYNRVYLTTDTLVKDGRDDDLSDNERCSRK